MILIHSALRDQPEPATATPNENDKMQDFLLRYSAYRETCEKHRLVIEAIRRYLPGWAPAPPAY